MFAQQFPIVFHSLNVGFVQTLKLFAVTLIGAIPLGLVIAFGSMSRFRPLSILTRTFVWIIRGTPLLLQVMIIFYGPGLLFDMPMRDRLTAVLVAFIIIPEKGLGRKDSPYAFLSAGYFEKFLK